jgi:NADPH:quinone reductase-like Zn-dependent oxidoreductase
MLRRALTPYGTLVLVGPGSGQWLGPVTQVLTALVMSRFGDQRMVPFLAKTTKEDLLALKTLIETGRLKPVLDRTYPLSETPEAIRYLETGQAQGKVVITV